MSQCKALHLVRNGRKNMTYANGTAQFHWGVSSRKHWVLHNVKKDPGCTNDLSQARPALIDKLGKAHDRWWNEIFPVMISKGGDSGNTGSQSGKLGKKVPIRSGKL